MALQGLNLITLSGWLCGIIILQKPWGRPSLQSYCTFSVVLVILNWSAYSFMAVDAYLHFREELLGVHLYGKNSVLNIVLRGSGFEVFLSNILTRLIFIFQAKKLAKLWRKLYSWNQNDASTFKFHKKGTVDILVVLLASLLNYAVATVDGIPMTNNFHRSWLSSLGYIPFCFVIMFWFHIPFVLPAACGFAAVLITLNHLRWAYEEYCSKIENLMKLKVKQGKKNAGGILTPEMKEKLVMEFEEIQEMFGWWESCLGPILFVIMIGTSIQLVCSASIIFLENSQGFHGWTITKDIGMLMICICKLYTLEYGNNLKKMFTGWKERLQKQSMRLGTNKALVEELDLNDLYLMVNNWDWKLSACGFFEIDRKMASGIISSMVTYVVILVQIKLAMEGAPGS